MIAVIVLFYYLYRQEKYGDSGCLNLLWLPLVPFAWLLSGLSKANDKLNEYEFSNDEFDQPPSLLLKYLVALTLMGIWIMGICVMEIFDGSLWWAVLLTFLVFVFFKLYIFWLKVFFAKLAKLRKPVAVTICVVLIILIIVFWIVAIKAFQYYTSIEYVIGNL